MANPRTCADRKHLTGQEVDRLLQAVKGPRNEALDRCLLLMFRHGLRVSEACRLKLDHVDPDGRVLHVVRLKRGLCTTDPLRTEELRAIRIDRGTPWLLAPIRERGWRRRPHGIGQ